MVTGSPFFGHGFVGRQNSLVDRNCIFMPVCSMAKFLRAIASSESSSKNLVISSIPSCVLLCIYTFAKGVDSTAGSILLPANSNIDCRVGFSASAFRAIPLIAAILTAITNSLPATHHSSLAGIGSRPTKGQGVALRMPVNERLVWFGKWL